MKVTRRSFVAAAAFAGACTKKKRTIVIGSKAPTEQALFGEILALHLERRLGRPVERRPGMPGTQVIHDALVGHSIDLYVEYSGAAYAATLKEEPSRDQNIMLERLRQQYRRNFLCEWLDPLGLDASYAVAASRKVADEGKLVTISDAAAEKGKYRFASSIEFQERTDGLPALSPYRISWKVAPKALDNERMYRQLADGLVDLIGTNITDGRMEKVDLVVLKDDKNVFAPQLASIVVRQDALADEPELQKYLVELTGKFNNAQMRDWNYKVDVIRRPVVEMAREFIKLVP